MILLKHLCFLLSLVVGVTAMPQDKKYFVLFNESYPINENMSESATEKMVTDLGGTVNYRLEFVPKGMVVTLPSGARLVLEQDERVKSVFEDTILYTEPPPPPVNDTTVLDIEMAGAGAPPTPWDLDRIDQQYLPLNGQYAWKGARTQGAGVNVCVIDSGFDSDYLNSGEILFGEFSENFADFGNAPGSPFDWDDCQGHGTHVAGLVGSRSYGVAPGATIWIARVATSCDPDDTGITLLGTLAALDWCAQRSILFPGKWIINMSLGALVSANPLLALAMEIAIIELRDIFGIMVVVAAGNDDIDACLKSPAFVPAAITVGATDITDTITDFSNFGPCVDILAPGKDIPSLGLKGPQSPKTVQQIFSGTSMSSPIVAGAAALFFQRRTTVDLAENDLLSFGVVGAISGLSLKPAVNLLAQVPRSGSRAGGVRAQATPKKRTKKQGRSRNL